MTDTLFIVQNSCSNPASDFILYAPSELISKSAIRSYVETRKFIILVLVQISQFEEVRSFVFFCFLVKIIISTDFTGLVNMNTSILFTELYCNMLFEIKWVVKSIDGNNTSPLSGNIPGDTLRALGAAFRPSDIHCNTCSVLSSPQLP